MHRPCISNPQHHQCNAISAYNPAPCLPKESLAPTPSACQAIRQKGTTKTSIYASVSRHSTILPPRPKPPLWGLRPDLFLHLMPWPSCPWAHPRAPVSTVRASCAPARPCRPPRHPPPPASCAPCPAPVPRSPSQLAGSACRSAARAPASDNAMQHKRQCTVTTGKCP